MPNTGRRISVRGRRISTLAAIGAAALVIPLVPAAATPPPLHIASNVGLTGVAPGGGFTPPTAEAPDGTVYVATLTGGKQTVWAAHTTGAAHIVERVTGVGTITAIAADATYLYVGTPQAITSYQRSTGALVRRWALSPTPRALSQIVVAGNRIWSLLTPAGFSSGPSSLVELDPTTTTRVRTLSGLVDTLSVAATATGVYYVTGTHSTLVHLLDTGTSTTVPSHLPAAAGPVGPGRIQAAAVSGHTFVVSDDFSLGLDALAYGYNSATLAGPTKGAAFTASATLGGSSLGLLETTTPSDSACPSTTNPCLVRYALASGGPVGAPLSLPYADSSAPLGPDAAVVETKGDVVHVLRIS